MFPGDDLSAWNLGGGYQSYPGSNGFSGPFENSGQYIAPIGSGYQPGMGAGFQSNLDAGFSGSTYPPSASGFGMPAPNFELSVQNTAGPGANQFAGYHQPSYVGSSNNAFSVAPAQPVNNFGGFDNQHGQLSYPSLEHNFGNFPTQNTQGGLMFDEHHQSDPTNNAKNIKGSNPSGGYPITGTGHGFAEPKPHEDIFAPTLRPSPNFDATEDCQRLRKAMKGLGTDEKAIIDIMGHRSVDQRMQIVLQFKTMYGKDLIKEFKSELSGHFYECVEALCYSPADFDAFQLRKAVKGAGTDEDALIEILCSRTNEQIQKVKVAYKQMYDGRDLEKDVMNDTRGHFKRIMVSLLQANRDESTTVDRAAARRDAEELYRAGEKKLGTDESKFNMILASKSFAHLRVVFEEYGNVSKNDIEKALKSEMSGDLLKSMLAIVRCIKNKQKYFAYQLLKSMKGLGTRDRTLIRIIVSRCEIDLAKIKEEFQRDYGKTLESWVSGDTTGDYKRLLLALISG